MSDPVRDAWTEVGAGFSNLGASISSKFARAPSPDDHTPSADDHAPSTDDAELRAALDRFVAAGRELGDRLAGLGRDEEIMSRAREASRNLDDALVTTVDAITSRLSGRNMSDPR